MKFNKKPPTKRQDIKVRVKAGRLHSGNTITALKFLRKLDKEEEEKKKHGTNGIESKQETVVVSIRDGKSGSISG
jgi:hypothetical protein